MTPACIHVREHEALIRATIARRGPANTDVLFVDDIHEECRRCGVPTSGAQSPIAQARGNASRTAGIIVFQSAISFHDIRGVIAGMRYRGTPVPQAIENDVAAFIEHLTLHELAHLVNNWDNSMESACDEWANARLGST